MRMWPALCVLLCSLAAAAAPPLRIAVYDFEPKGVDPRVASVVTEATMAELRKYEGLSVVGMSEVRAMLTHETNRQLLGCEDDTSCIAEVAGALGVDALVLGQCGRVGDTDLLTIKRVDVRQAKLGASATRRMPVADGQEFLSPVGELVGEILPGRALRPGAQRGVNPVMVKLLHPPPVRPWLFWTTAGTGLALAGVGTGFAVGSWSAQQDWHQMVELGRSRPVDGALLTRAEKSANDSAFKAQLVFAFAGTVALTALVEALFTDWHGYNDWQPGQPWTGTP